MAASIACCAAGRIGQVDGDDLRRDAAQAVGEALAALVERLVADFLVDAERVRDAGLGHALRPPPGPR